jgi:hypothetical protein
MKIDSFLKPEQQNETYLKKTLAHYLYWRLGYLIVIDEFNFRDIFGVRRTYYTSEFEIKVDKSDFDKEINSINSPQPKTRYGKEWTKWYKHAHYLNKKVNTSNFGEFYNILHPEGFNSENGFIPNDFYFYVPDYLCNHALKRLDNLPYGLVKIGKTASGNPDCFYSSDYEVVKKPIKLHKNKIENSLISKLAYALTIRSKLLN